MNIYKRISIATVLLGLNSFLVAKENDMSKEKKPKPAPTYSPYLGDKVPPYNNPNRFRMETSFIYWQADVDGLDFALSQDLTENVNASGSNTLVVGKFQDRRLDFQWDPGFKVGMGVVFGQNDEWDLFLNWTWLRSKAKSSFSSDIPPSLVSGKIGDTATPDRGFSSASFSSPFLFGPFTGAKANWELQYNRHLA